MKLTCLLPAEVSFDDELQLLNNSPTIPKVNPPPWDFLKDAPFVLGHDISHLLPINLLICWMFKSGVFGSNLFFL